MYVLFFIILFLYAILIFRYSIGWRNINISIPTDNSFTPTISIIIAMRNEEIEVDRLLKDLSQQIYPTDKLEIIIVNDHSTDNTLELLKAQQIDNLSIINMGNDEYGKKIAVEKAVELANGEIIVCTDADCSFTPLWIRTITFYFVNEEIKLVSGPVNFQKEEGFFHSFQSLEFCSLIGSGAGAIGINNPIFCNGANMAYRKEVFDQLNNFKNDKVVSGDDVFLLHSVKKRYPKGIAFAKNNNAVVNTPATQSLRKFINQRKRWTAKSTSYKDFSSIYTAYVVFLSNLCFICLLFLAFFDSSIIKYLIGFYIVKYIVDLFLLVPVIKFFKRKDLIKSILPFELIYSFYIVLVVTLSFTTSFEWKGRIHKK